MTLASGLKEKSSKKSTAPMSIDVVYLLWHTDAYGDEKLIGVYRTEADAHAALERTDAKPGFSDKGGLFEIADYRLNKDHWTEGFDRDPLD